MIIQRNNDVNGWFAMLENARKEKRYIWKVIVGIVLIVLLVWMIWGNTALVVEKITVRSGRLPTGFEGFRIAHLSDLHNAEFGEENEKLLRLLADVEPDMIAITGDMVDSSRTDIDIALAFAEKAVRIAPVYYVTGNHEVAIKDYKLLKRGLEAAGVTVLEDEKLHLEREGQEIVLLGLSDPDTIMKGDLFGEPPAMFSVKLERLLDGERDYYSIVLSHRPELFETYVSVGADLVLSGHAHGGQFRIPLIGGLIAPHQGLFPKYDAGLYTEGNTNMIVSRGLGNSVIPMRFNDRPEIVLVELER